MEENIDQKSGKNRSLSHTFFLLLSFNIDCSTFFKYLYIINIVRYFHGRNFHKDMFLQLCG